MSNPNSKEIKNNGGNVEMKNNQIEVNENVAKMADGAANLVRGLFYGAAQIVGGSVGLISEGISQAPVAYAKAKVSLTRAMIEAESATRTAIMEALAEEVKKNGTDSALAKALGKQIAQYERQDQIREVRAEAKDKIREIKES
jgi:hypothetical protein